MNYLEKLTWRRYQRLRREYKAAIQSKKWERIEIAQLRLDSHFLTQLLLNTCRRQGVDTTKE